MADAGKGMEVADMKRLLTKSKSEPVNVAVGLNGKDAVMLLNKQKQPKAVSKMLEDQFADIKNVRWGTAFVDIDADPKLVILTLNRAASGIGAKLKKTLKGTGFSKVRIQTEDGSVAEDVGEEDEEQEGEEQQAAAPNGQDTPEQPPERPQAQPTAGQSTPQLSQPQAQFNPAALTKRLGDLVKQMLKVMQGQPDRANELKQLAAAAQAAIKGGDEQAATQAVNALEQALGGGAQPQAASAQAGAAETGTAAAGAGANGEAVAQLAQSRVQWVSTRKQIEDEISKLHEAMAKHYEGHGFGADLDKVFTSKVEPILSSLDHSLADKLDEVGKATDPAQRSKLVSETQQVIAQYEQFVGSSPIIAQLEKNPFVPISIVQAVQTTLDELKNTVQKVMQNVP